RAALQKAVAGPRSSTSQSRTRDTSRLWWGMAALRRAGSPTIRPPRGPRIRAFPARRQALRPGGGGRSVGQGHVVQQRAQEARCLAAGGGAVVEGQRDRQ